MKNIKGIEEAHFESINIGTLEKPVLLKSEEAKKWVVENCLHWHLDFTFKDDKNTTMNKNGAKNLQIIKKIVLSILRIVQTFYKISLKMIRYKLSLDFDNEIKTIFKLLNYHELEMALKK